jgi:sec-independent protein translocase protein TatB
MFDLFAPSHLLLIAIAILVFVGPKDLPRFMHTVGKWTKKARRLADEFRDSLNAMEKQGELEELRKEIASLRNVGSLESGTGSTVGRDLSTEVSLTVDANMDLPKSAAVS